MNKTFLFSIFVLFACHLSFGQDEASFAPSIKTFALNTDMQGKIDNSINLFSGDVSLPITLISIPATGNESDISVSLMYSSNVQNSVNTWNVESPTGVLGLGWIFDYPKIVADNKNTGSRDDDDFYIVEGGASNELLFKEINPDGSYSYICKYYQFWKISFYPNSDYWIIEKENGEKYAYGFNSNSRQNIVKWGNWIGNSALIEGQSQQTIIWNLSSITDKFGSVYAQFEYTNIDEKVGSQSGLTFTKASYLSKITKTNAEQIFFYYESKNSGEYADPNNEPLPSSTAQAAAINSVASPEDLPREPDAYQERFETQYLDSILVKNNRNNKLLSIHFGYSYIGEGLFYKRLLSSITQKNASGETLPPMAFTYYSVNPNKGALATVTSPQGGSVTYVYSENTLTQTNQKLSVQRPADFADPMIYNADNYVVITWRSASNILKVYAYEWDGKWSGGHLADISGVASNNYQPAFESNFFSIMTGGRVYLFSKDEFKSGSWRTEIKTAQAEHSIIDNLVSGKNFAAFLTEKVDDVIFIRESNPWEPIYPHDVEETISSIYLNIYTMAGTSWSYSSEIIGTTHFINTSGYYDLDFSIGAANNYILINDNTPSGNDIIKVRYLNQSKVWVSKQLTAPYNTSSPTGLRCNNSNAVVFTPGVEYVISWTENFSALSYKSLDAIYDNSPVYENSHLCLYNINHSQDPYFSIVLRYTGQEWLMGYLRAHTFAFSHDFMIGSSPIPNTSQYQLYKHEYNPNTPSEPWTTTSVNNSNGQTPVAGPNFYFGFNFDYVNTEPINVYIKSPTGWTVDNFDPRLYITQYNTGEIHKAKAGNSFFITQFSAAPPNSHQSRIYYIKNGQISGNEALINEGIYSFSYTASPLVVSGSDIYVTFDANTLETSNNLYLHKKIGESSTAALKKYSVKYIDSYDKYTHRYTAIKYFTEQASSDPTGNAAQYNRVRIIPGASNPDITTFPNGYTENYFFNGLSADQVYQNVQYPANNTYTNARDYYKLLTGQIYATRTYDESEALKASSDIYYKIKSMTAGNNTAYYARAEKTEEMGDGIVKSTINEYNDYGLVKKSKAFTTNSAGIEDSYSSEYKYLKEAYPAVTQNLLAPVVQTKSFHNSTVTGISATTWKQWAIGWAPHKTYTRKTAPVSTDQFDFAAWSNTNEPGVDWQKTSEIISIDSKGRALETADLDGIRTSTVWNYKNEAISSFQNASANFVFAEDFNSTFINTWTLGTNWQVTSDGKLKHSGTSSSMAYPSNRMPLVNQYMIMEFDIRVVGTSGFAGFQFLKETPTSDYGPSSYTVSLSATGLLEAGNFDELWGFYQIEGRADDWQRIRIVYFSDGEFAVYLNGKKCFEAVGNPNCINYEYFGFIASGVECYIDNLRIYPENAYASSTSYNPDFGYAEASYPADGNVVKYVHNNRGELIGTVNPLGIPSETVSSSLSTDRNNGSYITTDPNVTLISKIQGTQGLYESFDTHLNKWIIKENANNSASTWNLQSGRLIHTNDGLGATTTKNFACDFISYDLGQELTGRVVMEASIILPTAILPSTLDDCTFGIVLGGNAWNIANVDANETAIWTMFDKGNIWYTRNNIYKWESITGSLKANKSYRIRIVVDVPLQKIDYYIDGKLYKAQTNFRVPTTGIQKIAFFNYGFKGSSSIWYVDDLMIYTDPVQTMTFSDGAGKELQAQMDEGTNQILVSQTFYDNLGRDYVKTKTTRYAGSFGYKTDFASLNTTTWEMSGKVVDNNGGEKFPYSRTVYEKSPLGRVTEASIPGATYKIGGEHTTKYTYKNEYLTEYYEYLPAVSVTDPQGNSSTVISDKWGKKVKEYPGPIASGSLEYNACHVDAQDLVDSFTPNIDATATYTFTHGPTSSSFTVYNSRGETLVNISSDGQGSFKVWAGVTYTLSLEGGIAAAAQTSTSGAQIALAPALSGTVSYYMWENNPNTSPITSYKYDVYGNLTEICPPNYYNPPNTGINKDLYKITNTYNSFLRQLTQTTSSDAGTIKYIYDKAGRLRFSMDALGEAQSTDNIKYTKYDGLGRVIEEGYISSMNWNQTTLQTNADNRVWPSTPATWRKKYYYGDLGADSYQRSRLVKIEVNNDADNTADVIESFVYDKMGGQASYSLKAAPYNTTTYSASYSYDNEGKTTKIIYPNASVVTYSYDRLGRTLNIGTPSAAAYFASYNYDKNGLMLSEKLCNNNCIASYTYNIQGRLIQTDATAYNQTLSYESGGYAGAGYYNGLIAKSYTLYNMGGYETDRTILYKYDNLGRLLVADNSNSGDVGVGSETTYDANGNILSIKKNGAATSLYVYYPGTGRLQNANGSTSSNYTYDNNGNLIASSTKGITGISYDPYFNLTTAITRSSGVLSFKYGATDQRVYSYYSGSVPEKTLYFHGLGEYPLMERSTINSAESAQYFVYGPTGMIAYQQNGGWYFIQKDYLGSVRAVFDETGNNQLYQNEFTPYGSLSMENVYEANPKYKFTGQEYDEETGLYNFRARLYDPDLGIFLGVDPARQNYAPFSYCGNNPVMGVDRDGKIWQFIVAAAMWQGFWGGVNAERNGQTFMEGMFTGAVKGAISGAISGGLGAAMGPANSFLGAVGTGATIGGVSGAVNAAMNGGNIGRGALIGGITGGAMSGVGYLGNPLGVNWKAMDRYMEESMSIKNQWAFLDKPPSILYYDGISGSAAIKWFGANFELGRVTDGKEVQFFFRLGFSQSPKMSLNIGYESGITTSPMSFDEFRGEIWNWEHYVNPVEIEYGMGKPWSGGFNATVPSSNFEDMRKFLEVPSLSVGYNISYGLGSASLNYSNINISTPSVPYWWIRGLACFGY